MPFPSSTLYPSGALFPGGEAPATPIELPRRLRYFAYDFLTGSFLAELPIRSVQFSRVLDGVGNLTASADLNDPRVQASGVLSATIPDRSLLVADWGGIPVWHGISKPRKWGVDTSGAGTTGILELSYVSTWAYFQQRVQPTDYSSPPYSGITGTAPMALWPQTPWFAPLIAAQIMKDTLTVPYGNPLGGMTVTLNGAAPEAAFAAGLADDYIAVNYPFPSLQMVESIISTLSSLGLGVGFDHSVEVSYANGKPEGGLVGRFEIDWPYRGSPLDTTNLHTPAWRLDLTSARKYDFPEDGSQTGWQVYEVGGGGAIYVDSNVNPPAQGYPLLERVISRSSIQSPNIMKLLAFLGDSDLGLYSYAPTTPSVSISMEDVMVPLGQIEVGDLVRIFCPKGFDPRFPNGLDQIWRLVSYSVDTKDEGDAPLTLTFARPPLNTAPEAPALV